MVNPKVTPVVIGDKGDESKSIPASSSTTTDVTTQVVAKTKGKPNTGKANTGKSGKGGSKSSIPDALKKLEKSFTSNRPKLAYGRFEGQLAGQPFHFNITRLPLFIGRSDSVPTDFCSVSSSSKSKDDARKTPKLPVAAKLNVGSENKNISRHHAKLSWRPGHGFELLCLGKNGMVVNGAPVTLSSKTCAITSRSAIRVGPLSVYFLAALESDFPPPMTAPHELVLTEVLEEHQNQKTESSWSCATLTRAIVRHYPTYERALGSRANVEKFVQGILTSAALGWFTATTLSSVDDSHDDASSTYQVTPKLRRYWSDRQDISSSHSLSPETPPHEGLLPTPPVDQKILKRKQETSKLSSPLTTTKKQKTETAMIVPSSSQDGLVEDPLPATNVDCPPPGDQDHEELDHHHLNQEYGSSSEAPIIL